MATFEDFLADDDDPNEDVGLKHRQGSLYSRGNRPGSASTTAAGSSTASMTLRGHSVETRQAHQLMSSLGPELSSSRGPSRNASPAPLEGRKGKGSRSRQPSQDLGLLGPPLHDRRASSRSASPSRGGQSMTSLGPVESLGIRKEKSAAPGVHDSRRLGDIPLKPSRSPSPAPLQGRQGRQFRDEEPGFRDFPPEAPRSRSPMPLDSLAKGPHSRDMTSVGPGLGGLSRASSRGPSPSAEGRGRHSNTSVGPGLGGLSASSKSRASGGLGSLDASTGHAMTSVGPGLDALSRRPSRPSSPVPREGHDELHSTTSVGPGLGGLSRRSGRSVSPAPLEPRGLQDGGHRLEDGPMGAPSWSLEDGPPPDKGSERRGSAFSLAGSYDAPQFLQQSVFDDSGELGRMQPGSLLSSRRPSLDSLASSGVGVEAFEGGKKKKKKHKKDKKHKKEQELVSPSSSIGLNAGDSVGPGARWRQPSFDPLDGSLDGSASLDFRNSVSRGREGGGAAPLRPASPSPGERSAGLRHAPPSPASRLNGLGSLSSDATSAHPSGSLGPLSVGFAPKQPPSPGALHLGRGLNESSNSPSSASAALGVIVTPRGTESELLQMLEGESHQAEKKKKKDKKEKKEKKAKKEKSEQDFLDLQQNFESDVEDDPFASSMASNSVAPGDFASMASTSLAPGDFEASSYRAEKKSKKDKKEKHKKEKHARRHHYEEPGAMSAESAVRAPPPVIEPPPPSATVVSQARLTERTDADEESRGFPAHNSSKPDASAAAVVQARPAAASAVKVMRFLLCFEPPVLAVEWIQRQPTNPELTLAQGKGGEPRRTVSRVELSSDLVNSLNSGKEGQGIRAAAERLLREEPFLLPQHVNQVEALLRRLASRMLPVYRIVDPHGVQALDGGKPSVMLPLGALVPAYERKRHPDGWWIRLAGGVWMRRDRGVELCEPAADEVRRWVQQASELDKATGSGSKLSRFAAAVAAQAGLTLGKQRPRQVARRSTRSSGVSLE